MKLNKLGWMLAVVVLISTSGCSAYRTSSNIKSAPISTTDLNSSVIISEDSLPGKPYKEIGKIEVSIKKATLFHSDPTKEQADNALIEKARTIGADAVINVVYKSGVGLTTWGYIDAEGTGVKLIENNQ